MQSSLGNRFIFLIYKNTLIADSTDTRDWCYTFYYSGKLSQVQAVVGIGPSGYNHKAYSVRIKQTGMIGFDGQWKPIMRFLKFCSLFFCLSPLLQARLNCKHCGKPVIDVRIGMQYFSEYSNVQQCPHCGNLDYHFVKPFSSFKVLEAYWQKLCHSNSYFMNIVPFILHIFYKICSVKGRGDFFLIERKVQQLCVIM